MLSLLLIMSAAAPDQFEDLALLDKNINMHANAEPVDKRLRLAKCPDAPSIMSAGDGVVVVRCHVGYISVYRLGAQLKTE